MCDPARAQTDPICEDRKAKGMAKGLRLASLRLSFFLPFITFAFFTVQAEVQARRICICTRTTVASGDPEPTPRPSYTLQRGPDDHTPLSDIRYIRIFLECAEQCGSDVADGVIFMFIFLCLCNHLRQPRRLHFYCRGWSRLWCS